ncbi:pyruvate carboxylase [Rhodospirillaceae bacterium KN72]|uniref:Pyruvate carboxylase n=1 Tax=Pacificispira spongiicola TaxID=2729598 RepID=A0A7Y0E088_9PROT|nr:pyruvate carboxylase [Pacificispira spongiicola]NMM44834.1 pyruvate carboxylase [Pacificispira spongiicola]
MSQTKLLVANRSEIAIRVMRAATELGIGTVAVYAEEDKLSLHRFKADESYRIGEGNGPVKAYLNIDEVIRAAKKAGATLIHPGYGFLSENPDFAEACAKAGITFIGPPPSVMRALGNKVSAREMAVKAGVPVMPATGPLPTDMDECRRLADGIGYPVMLKASWGGGGRGMRVIEDASKLAEQVNAGRREAEAAFGNGEVYLEKLVQRARHVEVQILGDSHGNIVHLFERDCSVQRRNQKVVERAPAPYLNETRRLSVCESALKLCREAGYVGAGTVEFLMDADTGDFYFIEVNPRVQVEHTVTEEVTGIDIVKAQIHIAQGGRIGVPGETGVPKQEDIRLTGHALQCRVTTEDPENNFTPDYGRITAYRGATGFGIRLDGGTAYSGAVITRYYDSLLEKVTARAATPEEAVRRMDRALKEFRIRGVATNLAFLENVINNPDFVTGDITTRFIDTTPSLFHFPKRRDRATRLLRFIADVTVNGNPEVAGRPKPPAHAHKPVVPMTLHADPEPGTKQILDEKGPEGFRDWMLAQKRVLITDTTMRDGHQSLLATRMRTHDMVTVAEAYSQRLPQLFSLECWGGATFDVAMRFLKEDPWDRLIDLREKVPNILLQMLLRASNAVGYTNYPDNAVQYFVEKAADAGMDVFRVFDSLNWADNMKVAMDAVLKTDRLCEAAICYTGDLFDKDRPKYDLDYYVALGRELKSHGAHILGIKDMAGLCRPAQIRVLVKALKDETGLPIHYHTHDTSGIAAATVLAACEAGADAVDAAMDSFSGLTSQPNLGSIVTALNDGDRPTGLDPATIRSFSDYWEAVRVHYTAFEPDLRAGASEVYLHEMPGGQFTNLKEQARALGLAERWHEVARMYAEVNKLFGDIVKVTPSSKVVGDMALYMVSSGITPEAVSDPNTDIAFPDSVVAMLRGDLGQPPGGWPADIQKKALKGEAPILDRPGKHLAPVDFAEERAKAQKAAQRHVGDFELASHIMYPKVFSDFAAFRRDYGRLDVLPTPVFFYGMKPGEEIAVDIDRGKTLAIRMMTVGEADEKGEREVFFDLNGQPRVIRVADKAVAPSAPANEKADPGNADHVPAPMPGMVSTIAVQDGQAVQAGDVLMTLEAMKMETTIAAPKAGTVKRLPVKAGTQVDAKDLLAVVE